MKLKKTPATKKSHKGIEDEIDFDKINELIEDGEELEEISQELNIDNEYLNMHRTNSEDEIYK